MRHWSRKRLDGLSGSHLKVTLARETSVGVSAYLDFIEAPQSAESGINPETSEFVLRWQSDVPKYSGDLDTYIWQRFRRPPSFAWIRIVIIDIDNLRNLRLLLLYKKSRSLEGFCSKIEAGKVYDGTSNPWTPTIAMMDTLSITFGVFLSDMIVFLREASKQISEMVRILLFRSCFEAERSTTLGFPKQSTPSSGENTVLDPPR